MTIFKGIIGGGLIALASVGVFLFGSASAPEPTPAAWPILTPSVTPNQSAVTDIRALVDSYYQITGEAAGTFDVSQFGSLFIDDVAVSLDQNQAALLALAKLPPDGFLSFELARYGEWKQGAEKLEKLLAQRKVEGRQLSATDLQSVNGPNGLPPSRRQEPVKKTDVIYKSFTLDASGKRALVQFDDHAVTQDMFFVKTNEGWRIAGKRNIDVHV